MALKQVEVRVSGKNTLVPAAEICGRTVIAKGGGIKTASILDDQLVEGELVSDPVAFVAALKQSGLPADVLTFFQRPPDVTPKFKQHYEWDNYAVVDTTSFEGWWENLPQEAARRSFDLFYRDIEALAAGGPRAPAARGQTRRGGEVRALR